MAIITISRGTLSGGEALAHCLSERLGYPVLSREVIRDTASQYGIAEGLLDQQLEKIPTMIQRRLVGGDERRLYLIAIQAALAERAQEGGFIYHGHLGQLLLKELPQVLKIRLLAPMDYRIRMVKDKQGLSDEAAKKYIEQVDKSRKEWARLLYNVDWQDPALYDMVISLDTIGLETACALIDFIARQTEFQDSPERKEIRAQFALACRIKLRLAQNDRTQGMQIGVNVMDQVARISGKFLSSGPLSKGLNRSKEDILEVVREFREIKKVEFDLKDAGIPVET